MLIQFPDISQWKSAKKIQSGWNLKAKILTKFDPLLAGDLYLSRDLYLKCIMIFSFKK